jgi:hypothetical protein
MNPFTQASVYLSNSPFLYVETKKITSATWSALTSPWKGEREHVPINQVDEWHANRKLLI